MEKPSKRDVQRITGALRRSKLKVVSLDDLSSLVGLYPDVLGSELAYFEPMILMDPTINIRDLMPALEEYIKSFDEKPKQKKKRAPAVKKTEVDSYAGITDFVYKKMTTAGGLVDTGYELSDKDLKILHKLVNREVKKRREEKKKKGSK